MRTTLAAVNKRRKTKGVVSRSMVNVEENAPPFIQPRDITQTVRCLRNSPTFPKSTLLDVSRRLFASQTKAGVHQVPVAALFIRTHILGHTSRTRYQQLQGIAQGSSGIKKETVACMSADS
jgi:hypothetical protein